MYEYLCDLDHSYGAYFCQVFLLGGSGRDVMNQNIGLLKYRDDEWLS